MELDQKQLEANEEMFKAQCHIYKHMYHYMESMSLKCAVQFGIPDIIHKHKKPVTLFDLVSILHVPSTKTTSLQRLMRILVHSGFFNTVKIEEEEEGYVLTPSSTLLLKDSPTTLSNFVLTMLNPELIAPWFSLSNWFKGKELTAFETFHGKSFWEFGKEDEEFLGSLKDLTACDSKIVSAIVDDHKELFEGFSSLVDVGGGTGTLAMAISDAFPHIKCTVFDLPQVVANLPETKNLKFVGGDMFQSVPCADAILLKSVLHNWSDEACVNILKRCKEAMPSRKKGGKLIIIEMVMNSNEDDSEVAETKIFADLQMMLLCSGKERNEEQWKNLFLEAGFSHYTITATSGLNSIIEVYP